jgi:hypothetical protein
VLSADPSLVFWVLWAEWKIFVSSTWKAESKKLVKNINDINVEQKASRIKAFLSLFDFALIILSPLGCN